ncbi:MAG: metalloregulator ArsR/SmtB family transcription factor [Lachnospiraceae bacterium]|nr:metalloregulator ArsR/SmtB family transcription factor [Lachnospiraceae bacterium]
MKKMDVVLICKALSDSNRLEIVQVLSEGEKCGCRLLERFEITQPTLSHHVKILVESGIVNDRKEGKWHYYSLNTKTLASFKKYIENLVNCDENNTKKSGYCRR